LTQRAAAAGGNQQVTRESPRREGARYGCAGGSGITGCSKEPSPRATRSGLPNLRPSPLL